MLRKIILGLFFVLPFCFLQGCDNLFVNEEEAKFNVYYYPPDSSEALFLGEVQGIKKCRLVVQARAHTMGKVRKPKDYVCCLVTKTSSCEKRMD